MDHPVDIRFQAVLLDIDGVLTDGTVTVDARGSESKTVAFDDIDAVFQLKRAGILVGFVTGEDTPFVDYVQARFAPDILLRGCKDKLAAAQRVLAERGIDPSRVCYVGDSRHDVPLLRFLPHSFAPADAAEEARAACGCVLSARRGRGAVREVARYALSGGAERPGWERALEQAVGLLDALGDERLPDAAARAWVAEARVLLARARARSAADRSAGAP